MVVSFLAFALVVDFLAVDFLVPVDLVPDGFVVDLVLEVFEPEVFVVPPAVVLVDFAPVLTPAAFLTAGASASSADFLADDFVVDEELVFVVVFLARPVVPVLAEVERVLFLAVAVFASSSAAVFAVLDVVVDTGILSKD